MKRRGHGLDREPRGVCGGVWIEEREQGNDITILQFQNNKTIF